MTATLTQLKSTVALRQLVNQRRFIDSTILFQMFNCFKMYEIKMKEKKKKKREMKILKNNNNNNNNNNDNNNRNSKDLYTKIKQIFF